MSSQSPTGWSTVQDLTLGKVRQLIKPENDQNETNDAGKQNGKEGINERAFYLNEEEKNTVTYHADRERNREN